MNEDKTSRKTGTESTEPVIENMRTEGGQPMWVTILAVAGILAVVLALGIGIFQIANRGKQNLSDITTGLGGLFQGKERLVLTTPAVSVNSGDDIEIKLEHRNKKSKNPGEYILVFECEEGTIATLDGKTVPCDTEVALGEETPEKMTITLTTSKERYESVPVVLEFIEGQETVKTDLLFTVVNTKIASEPTEEPDKKPTTEEPTKKPEQTTGSTTPTYITVKRYGGRYSDPNGTPDLEVTIDNVGIDRNGNFRPRKEINRRDRAAVAFTITNVGTKETGEWYFSALLPTEDGYYFRSDNQRTLLPGDRIEYVLAFDGIEGRGETRLFVQADPLNKIREISEVNNIAKAVFDIAR